MAYRAEYMPGRPSKTSTSSPESSANAQVFVSKAAAFAFKSAFSKYVSPVSSTLNILVASEPLKTKHPALPKFQKL